MSKPLALVLVLITTFFWGASFAAGKEVVEHIQPLAAAAARFVIASALLVVVLGPYLWRKRLVIARNKWAFVWLGITGVAGFSSLFLLSVKYTSPINASLIMAANPMVASLLSVMFLKERISWAQVIGMAMTFVGVGFVVTEGSLEALTHFHFALGDWIMMVANVLFALYGVLNRRYVVESDSLTTTASSVLIGTVCLVLIACFEPGGFSSLLHQSWKTYSLLVFLGICASALGYLFWTYGVNTLGVMTTSLFFNVVPLFALLIAFMLGTPILPVQLIGGSLVIAGVVIAMELHKQLFNIGRR